MKGLILLAFLVGISVSEPIRHKVADDCASVRSPVGECPSKDPANPVFLPDSERCELYYECSNGIPVQNHCPPDEEFNPTINVCTLPSTSGCEAPNHHATDPPASTTDLNSFDEVDFDEINVYDVDGTCPTHDTNETIYLADTKNCTVYYVCSNGRPITLTCPPQMEFSPSEHVCVLDIDSDCVIQPGNESVKIKKQLPKSAVGECPPHQEGPPSFLPDSSNCQIYYECSNGEPVQNHCADKLEWNTTLNTCVPPEQSNCKITTSSSTSSSTSTSDSTSPPDTTAFDQF